MYHAPIDDMKLLLFDVVETDFARKDLDPDTCSAILEEAAKLARDVIGPLNTIGDAQGCKLDKGQVSTPQGFRQAYAQYRDNGWNSVPFSSEAGGQDLPWSLTFAIQEMWQSANMSFGLCPMLNQSAVEALEIHGSSEQKALYLEKMVSGHWTGTMNLTEPQAGSDLSELKTMAVRQEDGSYKITGQKIYITYGEHDLADNIIHMILARTPEAPEGTKGISLFLVPKFIPDEKGNPGKQNDLVCTGIEHKLGIHGSPTCTMQFGDKGGATGWLVGGEFEGLKLMFTMMNNARLAVGLQGVALSERALQKAKAYAEERIQGRPVTGESHKIPISKHPDVGRMLNEMEALTLTGRALTYYSASLMDKARNGDKKAAEYVDLLTPVTKAWCTDNALKVTSDTIQVHGGMGFIEETGVAQYYRDARILPIYEGTNGIQANDFVFRKILRDKGETAQAFINENIRFFKDHKANLQDIEAEIQEALTDISRATEHVLNMGENDRIEDIAWLARPYLQFFGLVTGAIMAGRIYEALSKPQCSVQDQKFIESRKQLCLYYIKNILPETKGQLARITQKTPV